MPRKSLPTAQPHHTPSIRALAYHSRRESRLYKAKDRSFALFSRAHLIPQSVFRVPVNSRGNPYRPPPPPMALGKDRQPCSLGIFLRPKSSSRSRIIFSALRLRANGLVSMLPFIVDAASDTPTDTLLAASVGLLPGMGSTVWRTSYAARVKPN